MKLPAPVSDWLARCGTSPSTSRTCRIETRLFHDLGLYGDIAEAYMEELVTAYGVDLKDFRFEKYFPAEFAGNSALSKFLITYIPFFRHILIDPLKYEPITLEMIHKSIKSKKWMN